jgi:uncharacterized protein
MTESRIATLTELETGLKTSKVSSIPAQDERITQLDVMRGFAVLGIFLVNLFIFALPSGALTLPHLMGEQIPLNIGTWAFSEIFIEGTMRGLFSMLFGASALVFLSEARMTKYGAALAEQYYRRALLLILFGILHAYFLLNTLEVLYAYGIFGMFLFPLRQVNYRTLLTAGLALLAFGSISISTLIDNEGTQTTTSYVPMTSTEQKAFEMSVIGHMAEEIEGYKQGYFEIFSQQVEGVVEWHSMEMYNFHLFDVGGMMLIGMALFKMGILSGSRNTLFYTGLAILGYGLGGGLRSFNIFRIYVSDFDPNMIEFVYSSTFYDIDRLLIVLGHIGLIGLICKAPWLSFLTNAFAATGRMTLTNYVCQTVICVILFYGFGFGLVGSLERYELYGIVFLVWLAQVIFSIIWLKYFLFGPLEWIWRSLTYGKRVPNGTG